MIEQEINEYEDIYKENVLDHYKNPHNFGELENSSLSARESNPLCGDKIELFLKVECGKVKDVKFRGQGCAISMASASMLTDKIKGMSLDEIKSLTDKNIIEMIGINLNIVRIKCGLLSLKTLLKALQEKK